MKDKRERDREKRDGEERVLDREDLDHLRKRHRGERIVFTNGCFDILHMGHIWLLREASALGDRLVVGINSDDSIRRLKGQGRPLSSQEDRAGILLELRSVDYVTIFEEDTPLETIRALRPDILVKGDEYSRDEIVGAVFMDETGGRVKRVPMMGGYSTSGLIEKIREGL